MKKNGTIIWTISMVLGILLALVGIIWGFARQSGNLDRAVSDVKAFSETATGNKMELIGVKKDIGYLTEKVDRNYIVQQQILTEIKELR